jgi:hypothetical protein
MDQGKMPEIKVPYLGKSENEHRITLVLDMDETLVHS